LGGGDARHHDDRSYPLDDLLDCAISAHGLDIDFAQTIVGKAAERGMIGRVPVMELPMTSSPPTLAEQDGAAGRPRATKANDEHPNAPRADDVFYQDQDGWRQNPDGPAPTKFKLVKLDDIPTSTTTDYLIKGLIPRRGLVIVWGPPKCGKSFKVFTWMMHVALGRPYRGRRVHQQEVVYLALEGQDGFGRPRDAFYKRCLEPGEKVPRFYFCGATLDLIKDHRQLIADIRAQSAIPGCVVIDTLNRSLNGSESSDEDMAAT
jgi:hypothetical protein